jgi:predicted  nucleic acid-binding Zn-ribbon protein
LKFSKTLFCLEQDGNAEATSTPVEHETGLAQDIGNNDVEAIPAQDKTNAEPDGIPTNTYDSETTIPDRTVEITHSSDEGTQLEIELESNEDEEMPEATEGGSDILPVSSTSKLSADIGLSEMQFIAMQKSDPAAALKMLLTSKTASDSEINSTVRQDSLLLRLHTDYINQNIFSQIEANPSSAFSHLGFLKKLHNPLTDGATLSKVIQLENLIDGFTQAIQKKQINVLKLEAQVQAHAALVEKARTAQANVECWEKDIESNPEITACNEHITAWEAEVVELNLRIQTLNIRINDEKTKREEARAKISSTVKAKIEKEANAGIKFFSASAAIDEEIQGLEKSNKILDKEISSFQSLYEELKKQF